MDAANPPTDYVSEPDRSDRYFPRMYSTHDMVEVIGDTRASTSGDNWGKKLDNANRYMRKKRSVIAGVYSADVQGEERARKRIKLLLPSRSPSPATLEPPGFEEFHSPPTSPHLPPTDLDPAPSLSSFLASPGIRHSFDPSMLNNLSEMTRDLIESEGEGTRSLGRLFWLLSEKASHRDLDAPSNVDGEIDADSPNGMDGIKEEPHTPAVLQFTNGIGFGRNGRSPSMAMDGGPALPMAYQELFVTPGGVTLPDRRDLGEAETYFPSAAHQVTAVNQWLTQIRGVYDDLREYTRQLDRVHVGIAIAQMGRKRVWAAVRTEVARELDISLPRDSGEQAVGVDVDKS
ncbi:hypothetical protein DACRYDRAFT_22940 [Dacryopinax primogenitus]|uniref:Uncharacterized protein n=1 Tax=Dacryopinax primogenitus (strain DJM 731) TaxID=1858805 RepID=M5FXJ8_DACPD|nr:uncharacterized protein DACRYDRAFT_22940 [Dacryopinax primogenitus]EJU01194.1 hypothetical protein DACRYDRAFT_22940 [Dacryopinax primogenitus]